MKYYLVKYNGNYADEFDVYFHQVMSEDELKELKECIGKTNWEYEEFYFGTNEWIDVNTTDLLKQLDNVIYINDEEYEVLEKLGLLKVSFGDGLNWDTFLEYTNE
jgi:hypothetical protein